MSCRCFSKETRGALLFVGTSLHLKTGRLLGISFMSLAELERWPLERAWGPWRKTELGRHLAHYTARSEGQPIQTADAWIAASALYYHVPLITNNGSDYSMVRDLIVLSA
jgi:hypothetical protein